MKRTFTSIAALAACVGIFAQEDKPVAPVMPEAPVMEAFTPEFVELDGTGATYQYFYNESVKGFLAGGNDYGTRASYVADLGYQFKFAPVEGEETFTLTNICIAKGSKEMTCFVPNLNPESVYVDNSPAGAGAKTFTFQKNDDGSFYILNTAIEGKYLAPNADNTIVMFTDNAEMAKWRAVSIAEYEALTSETGAIGKYKAALTDYNNNAKKNYDAEYATYIEELKAWTEENLSTVGVDLAILAPTVKDAATAKAVWTGASGLYAALGMAEIWQNKPGWEGNVMVQTMENVINGVYEVTVEAAASTTGSRDNFEIITGKDMSYVFANDAEQTIEVFDRLAVGAKQVETFTIMATVVNHTLTFGIKNKVAGGNWFIIKLKSIVLKEVSANQDDPEPEPEAIKGVNANVNNGAIYNLAGQKVNENYKGIVIKNGKTTVNK